MYALHGEKLRQRYIVHLQRLVALLRPEPTAKYPQANARLLLGAAARAAEGRGDRRLRPVVSSGSSLTATADVVCHGMRQTLQGSFSAVSKRNFASKYAFERSRRDLHNALLCTALQIQFFCQNCAKNLLNSVKFSKNF